MATCSPLITPEPGRATRAAHVYDYSVGVTEPLSVILERYRLDALIGEGGMAGVWRAWDLTLQRQVAVKLLFARDARDEDALVKRFLREARIAASVQHRNVIHIVDFGTTAENQPFMVMELLEGETLAARLRREKRLSVADTVQIANLTLRGLSAVHAAGIIHRDLKPDNVYLKTEGGVVYPKILDFGISRSIEPASGSRSALTTRDGVIVGTPEYMSPEQARGVKRLDYRTDLYSMGVMLYEALTGRLPYRSENVGDLIIKIVTGLAPKVHELAPDVPLPLSEVVARAMSRDAGDRFADANAMQEALLEAVTRALGARVVHAMSDLPPQRMDLGQLPLYLRTTRRPPSLLPRTEPVAAVAATAAHASPAADQASLQPSAAAAPALAAKVARTSGAPPRTSKPAEANDASLAPTSRVTQKLADWRHRWSLPLAAASTLLGLGALILWLAPSLPTERILPARTAHAVVRIAPEPPHTVTLKLRGVPDGASITLDGQPKPATFTLPRGSVARSLVVTANGKLPWRMNYVAAVDQELQVALRDAPAPPSKAKPKRGVHRTKHHAHKSTGALRVPDF
jgi:serine/threonine protein kinase